MMIYLRFISAHYYTVEGYKKTTTLYDILNATQLRALKATPLR